MSAERAVWAAPEAGHDAGPAEQMTTHTSTEASPGAQSVQTQETSLVRGNIAPGIVIVRIIILPYQDVQAPMRRLPFNAACGVVSIGKTDA